MFIELFFYLVALSTILASLMVINFQSSVHAVLSLIFAFFSASGLFLVAGAEFFALLIIVVYVGAVAVLFLFVVMMLDLKKPVEKSSFLGKVPVFLVIIGGFAVNFILMIRHALLKPRDSIPVSNPIPADAKTNLHALGEIIYTDHFLHFQISGIILFAAVIGCIALTLRQRGSAKKQDVFSQISNDKKSSVELVKINRGEGIK